MDNQSTNPKPLQQTALGKAITQVGEKESPKGTNCGPMVNKYLIAAGLRPGFAWCQAFTYWCYEQAATELQTPNPAVKTASVHACWEKTPEHNKIHRAQAWEQPDLLKPGMQMIYFFTRGMGHTGIVESVDVVNKVINTIEGNSNANGSREGYEVVRHTRKLNDASLAGFIKYE